MQRLTLLIVLLPMVFQGACHAPVASSSTTAEAATSVYVVSHGWHTGIVVKRNDIPDGVWPEHHDFPEATYVEVGWGDQDFYQAPKTNLSLALKAVFQATPSVLYITGFIRPVTLYFPHNDLIEVKLSRAGLARLCTFIHKTYKRDEAGSTRPLGDAAYGTSRFYQANGTYHLFNTCNNWTAKALREAGCPITPSQAMAAENVMQQVSRFGNVIRATTVDLHQQETFCR